MVGVLGAARESPVRRARDRAPGREDARVYSLVSAPVLAVDLVRHPYGAAVADVVDRVLVLSGRDLAALGAPRVPDPRRDAARVAALAGAHHAPRSLGPAVGPRTVDPPPTDRHGRRARTRAALLDALVGALLGTLDDLHALLLREAPLRDASPAVRQAALDAVTAAWAGRVDAPGALELLRAPFDAAVAPLPLPLPDAAYGGGGPVLRDLLDAVARLPAHRWLQVAQAHRATARASWSQAVHRASRVAYDGDRLVPVARAQLAAARALRLSPVSTTQHATPAAMAVTAAVQAACLADRLDPALARSLTGPWLTGSTGAPPSPPTLAG